MAVAIFSLSYCSVEPLRLVISIDFYNKKYELLCCFCKVNEMRWKKKLYLVLFTDKRISWVTRSGLLIGAYP